eukprot:COSAG02_NODE_10781_length_1859_cov_1.415909_1_plen_209_part_10
MLSRQSSASNAEQQDLEREVLQSIFAEDFSELQTDPAAADGCRRWRLAIAPHNDEVEKNHLALALHAQVPAAYPSVVPIVTIEVVQGLSSKQCLEVQALCEAWAEANVGTAMIFAIADEVKDWLVAQSSAPPDTVQAIHTVGGMATGGQLQRQESLTSEATLQWATEQRRKKRREAKLQRKIRPGTITIGSEIEMMARNGSMWLPGEIL